MSSRWHGELVGGPFDGDRSLLKSGLAPPGTLWCEVDVNSPGAVAWRLEPTDGSVPYALGQMQPGNARATYFFEPVYSGLDDVQTDTLEPVAA
jgi:hypothetical protein